jgi:hypothetical protein
MVGARSSGERLEVLGGPGKASLPEVNYSDVISCTLSDGFVAPLFNASPVLRALTIADLELLDTLCSELTRVNSHKKPPAWIDANRYGTNNIGSLMTFSHSSPKATLPCFRAGGELRIPTAAGKHKTVAWKPLFSSRLSAVGDFTCW